MPAGPAAGVMDEVLAGETDNETQTHWQSDHAEYLSQIISGSYSTAGDCTFYRGRL
jgi:hypothetical protein